MTDNLSNTEAILNICVNVDEILGIRYAILLVLSSLFLLKLKLWKTAGIQFALGVASLVFGLATPGVINWLVDSAKDVNALNTASTVLAVVMGVVTIVSVLTGIWLLYFPVYIAKKNGKQNLGRIIGLSCFSILVPFLWPFATYFAYKPHKPLIALEDLADLHSSREL